MFSSILIVCLLFLLRKSTARRKYWLIKENRRRAAFPPFNKFLMGMKSLATNGSFMILAISFALIQMVICVTYYNLGAVLFPFNYCPVIYFINP